MTRITCCPRGPGVAERVRQRLLHDPVRGEVDARRQLDRIALDAVLDRQARVADLLDEPAERRHPRLRRERGQLVRAAEHPEQAAHLGERGAAGLLDGQQRLALALLLGRQQPPDGPGLDGHHRDAVGDDVVQLARDPLPLLRDRPLRLGLAVELGARRPLPRRPRVLERAADHVPAEPDGREERARAGEGRDEGLGLVGVRRDHRQRADDDRQALVRLHVGQEPEQERAREGGDEPGQRERHEVLVPERERAGGEEHERRRRERELTPPEQDQREPGLDRDCRPERDVRRLGGVSAAHELEDRSRREQDDRGVEETPPRERDDPGHGRTVLQARAAGLLRRDDPGSSSRTTRKAARGDAVAAVPTYARCAPHGEGDR
jgi:hypothetical protein